MNSQGQDFERQPLSAHNSDFSSENSQNMNLGKRLRPDDNDSDDNQFDQNFGSINPMLPQTLVAHE